MIKTDLILQLGNSIKALEKDQIFQFPRYPRSVFFIMNGILKIASTNIEGKEAIKYILKAGDFFGQLHFLQESENKNDYAVAMTNAEIVFIDVETLRQFMREHAEIREEAYKQFAMRLKKAEERMLSFMFKDAPSRITSFLLEFSREFGIVKENGYEVKNILTHDEIAKLTATSRQTVSTVLNNLREQKALEYNSEVLRIPFSSVLLKSA